MRRKMADPQTCRHNIITAVVNIETLDQWFACVSCNTKLTMEWIKGRNGKYVYDKAERVWVYMSKTKAQFLEEATSASTRSDENLRESKIVVVGSDMTIEPDEIIVKDPKYNDGEWFIDIQDGEEQIWEVQYNMDLNEHVWVAVIHRSIWKPRGRQIERPSDQELGIRE